MVKYTPNNQPKECSHNEKHEQVETYIPNTFFEPHWPQSEAHETQDDHSDDYKIECLSTLSCRVYNHVKSLVRHWSLWWRLDDVFWNLFITVMHTWVFSHLNDELVMDHQLTKSY